MLIESKYNRMYMPSLPSKMGNRPRPTVWECTPPRPADPEGQLRASLDAHCAGTPIHDAQERNVLQVLPSMSKLKSHAKQNHSNKAHPSTCRYDVSCHLPNEVLYKFQKQGLARPQVVTQQSICRCSGKEGSTATSPGLKDMLWARWRDVPEAIRRWCGQRNLESF